MQLFEMHELNLVKIQDLLSVVSAGHPMGALGEEMQLLCEAFQARGVFHLLLDFDPAAFSRNLQRSAHARRFFLRKSREQSSRDTVFVALSRTEALLDCIAGGDWLLAPQIRQLSPSNWTPGGEYQESYAYYSLIHAYVAGLLGVGDPAEAWDWLRRLEAVVADIPDSVLDACRLEVCDRFLAGDEEGFWSSFRDLVEITGDLAAAVPLDDGRVYEFPWLEAGRHVSVELLAWMALARRRGFRPPEREYSRCPSAAWIDPQVPPVSDLFLRLEARFHL